MENELKNSKEVETLYNALASLINSTKNDVAKTINVSLISLYWNIGKMIDDSILKSQRADYGETVIKEISIKLTNCYGKGFNRAALFRMIQFYQEFSDYQIVATLSQQLTWSHFVELLPIEDPLKRDFYAAMCKNERWSVRTLRERKKSMLYERTAISQKPELTIQNEIAELRDDRKMSVDMFILICYSITELCADWLQLNLNSENLSHRTKDRQNCI